MKHFFILLCAIPALLIAQNPEIKSELPNIIPPSPSVAALMKFEEVPVSNYTGIPNISIPLFSSATKVKAINIAVSLDYHPSGVAADERASDVGLGWSLVSGGSISRTVKGFPDEIHQTGSVLPGGEKYGIYRNDVSNITFRNTFYETFDDLNTYYDISTDSVSQTGFEKIDRFLWGAQVQGVMDTEHDLWQFSFMGKSGRFYIKKNSNNQLEIVPLDDYRVKIQNIYGNATNPYEPTSFIITDENGFKYKFDVIENTEIQSLSHTLSSATYEDYTSASASYYYNSAFHLREIRNINDELIVDFIYNSTPWTESVLDSSTTYNQEVYDEITPSIRDFFVNNGNSMIYLRGFNPLPIYSINGNLKKSGTRKIQEIRVNGICKINFEYQQGRLDENYQNNSNCYTLKQVTYKNWNDTAIKLCLLTKDYSDTKQKRLILTGVTFKNFTDSKEEKYSLEYRENVNPYASKEYISKDYWGYFNLKPSTNEQLLYKKTDPVFCTTETLQKMSLPTGGCIIYHFEPNTYSYIRDTQLTDFNDNINNWNEQSVGITYSNIDNDQTNNITTSSNNKRTFFSITEKQDVVFTYDLFTTSGSENYTIKIFKEVISTSGTSYVLMSGKYIEAGQADYNHSFFTIRDLLPGNYKIVMMGESLGTPDFLNANIYAFYHNLNNNNYQFLYGGGMRIAKIGFFEDNSVSKDYYTQINSGIQPLKEKKYDYSEFSSSKSSGSLAYFLPKFEYRKYNDETCYYDDSMYRGMKYIGRFYDVSTTFNNLNPVKTQGADIGYKNVKVFEVGNGYTKYTYSNAIDYPETITNLNTEYPFLETENIDYKRGQIQKESIYDESGRILNETNYEYDIQNFIETTGIKTYYPNGDFKNVYNITYITDYINFIKRCGQNSLFIGPCNNVNVFLTGSLPNCNCEFYYGFPREFISAKMIKQNFGWVKLKSKETKNYFYDVANNLSKVVTSESYSYNAFNKMIAEHSIINSQGEETKSTYTYLTLPDVLAQNRIGEIEQIQTEKDGTLLSNSKIVYSNTLPGSTSYQPAIIQTAKGTNPLENKIRYNRYDTYGNPLEVQQENGMLIAYIWGYNNSQVVAKIENISYSAIPSSLITAIQTATNSNSSETVVLGTLDALRNHSALANSMVTTVTHIPLVGVSTMTTPNGVRMKYYYDSMNRLEKVTDHYGNIVTENLYNYRP